MDSRILETAIGLVLVYLFFSLFCSAINEWIARLLALRATGLRRGINELLSDENEESLARAFHNHALINALKPGKVPVLRHVLGAVPLVRRAFAAKDRANYPSYIAAKTFALTVMDLTMDTSPSRPGHPPATAVLKADFGPDGTAAASPLLQALLKDVEHNALAVRTRLEGWFDDSMERVSGWYKRRIQVSIVFIAAILAIGFNVDSIRISRALFSDPALREALANQADAVLETGSKSADSVQTGALMHQIDVSGLPIGWTSTCRPFNRGALRSCGVSFLSVLGLLLTIVALAQGAPFWFDTLNKLANLRQTGDPPKKTEG